MNFKTTIKLSLKELLANKFRSILTMLGVIIGVFSIVVIVSLGQGVTNYFNENLYKEAETIRVYTFNNDASKIMNYDEVMAFYEKIGVKLISPEISSYHLLQYKKEQSHINVRGINHHYSDVSNIELLEGRFIKEIDVKRKINSVVLNDKAKEELFNEEDPIGHFITIEGIDYKVVGVISSGESSMFNYVESEVYVPITSLTREMNNTAISNTTLGADSKQEVLPLSAKVTDTLTEYYRQGVRDGEESDEEVFESMGSRYSNNFYVYTPEKELEELNKILNILSIGLGGIAGISLLVGGIGIMNIMFVSVTERTREIGIRKAIGAKRKTIVAQFLVESAIVSGIGGIIGLILAKIAGFIIGIFAPLKPDIEIHVMLLAVAFSALIGIIFGIYPANKAAKLKPIDALRFE